MRRHLAIFRAGFCAVGMLILILDTKTAVAGAASGIAMCLKTVIPSLFPFFLFSNLLTKEFTGRNSGVFSWIGRFLKIPSGSEYIYLAGLIGGYPVGAGMLSDARRYGQISRDDGNRMIAFCSNAGPAFIFGIGTSLFDRLLLCFAVWLITIISGVFVALMVPGKPGNYLPVKQANALSLTGALKKSIMTMALVCGWVVLFRVVLSFLDRWVLWLLSEPLQSVVYGILEMSNGCCALTSIPVTGLRITLFSLFLSFGGLCVMLQTVSVLDGSGIRPVHYLKGKITQAAISFLLCQILQRFLPEQEQWNSPWFLIALSIGICAVYIILTGKRKKPVAIHEIMMYNEEKLA